MSRSAPNARPEPASLTTEPAKPVAAAEAERLLAPHLNCGSEVILAVSGGPDSVALMRLAAACSAETGVGRLCVATIDHGLRQGSDKEAEQVADWAAQCRLPCRILAWSGPKPRAGLPEKARSMRYRLLAEFACEIGAPRILTAHTLDDQAETVVMRLLRGSGIEGLAGMNAQSTIAGVILGRPFLSLRKGRLVATCRASAWPFFEDPSNADPRFTRNRLRGEIMPLLAAEGFTPERAAQFARRARRAEQALAVRATAVLAEAVAERAPASIEIAGAVLLREPDAVILAVLARCLAEIAPTRDTSVRLERLEKVALDTLLPALADGRRIKLNLGGALLETSRDGRLRITPEPPRRRARSTPA